MDTLQPDRHAMKRSGRWHRQRISRRLTVVGGAVLGLVLALVAITNLASADRRVILVDTRPILSVIPPFTYENDQRRFMKLVVMPICPGNLEPLVSMGRACRETRSGVRVELRDDLVAGEDATAVHVDDLAQGLKYSLAGYEVTVRDDTLSIGKRRTPTVPPSLLVPWLRVQSAAIVAPGQSEPVGTGPFYVDELWCRKKPDKPDKVCSRVGGSPPVRLGDLDGWLEDVLVLRRRDWSGMATTAIVVVGLRGEPDGGTEISPLVPRTTALARALDSCDVHGVFDVEADLEAELEEMVGGRPEGWRFREPRQDRVLVAALHRADSNRVKEYLPSQCRSRLVHALGKIRQDPTFLRALGARPADQLLPEPFKPVHTWHGPAGESPEPCSREIDLVTNKAWEYAADEIAERLRLLDSGLEIKVSALPPAGENARREGGDYGISLLAMVYEPRPDAYYLWENLRSVGWATDEHLQKATDLAAKEAKGDQTEEIYAGIDELHRALDAYLIPMAAPTRVVAASDRLLGLDPGGAYLDPDDLRLAPSASQFLVRSLLLIASVVLLALAATSHILRKASARRWRVELSLRMLRHDLLAPLATIRANAERVLNRDQKIGEALLSEAEAALSVAEDACFVLQKGKLQAHGSASTRLRDEVIEPILDNLRRRSSYETGEEPTITLDLPDEPPPVSVPPEVAKFVVRTLVESAWRHRGDRPLVLELSGTISGGFFQLEVKDRGPGITPDEAARLFRSGPDTADRDVLQGSGMGLHLARSVLRLHRGEIELRRPADPTIFTILIPLASTGRGKPDESPETEAP